MSADILYVLAHRQRGNEVYLENLAKIAVQGKYHHVGDRGVHDGLAPVRLNDQSYRLVSRFGLNEASDTDLIARFEGAPPGG